MSPRPPRVSSSILTGRQQKGLALSENRISDASGRRRGVSVEEMRRHNLAAVLDRLHIRGPLSRSQLARQTGLNRSTIGDLIGELVSLGMVEEDRGTTSNGPGRPSSVARTNPAGAVVQAIELIYRVLAWVFENAARIFSLIETELGGQNSGLQYIGLNDLLYRVLGL